MYGYYLIGHFAIRVDSRGSRCTVYRSWDTDRNYPLLVTSSLDHAMRWAEANTPVIEARP